MDQLAIRVEQLGKQYRIGKRECYQTLRDTLADSVTAPFRRIHRMLWPSPPTGSESPSETIWALKDVSFEVPRGAVLGVIGGNGAGKSTLLKVLSRITEPTEGRVQINGRVGSLLEVGTGFHTELTGRENIFLNGAILGMKRAEIGRKFDEIVAFAEVDKFVDTPVKHYSSGMYMRLAFAVAAHLEPEILVVDEVLAVGDAAFQKKCLGKMGDVAKEGRTIIFVSHQMNQIRRLCRDCIWLQDGRIQSHGPTQVTAGAYEGAGARSVKRSASGGRARRLCQFTGWRVVKPNSEATHMVSTSAPVTIAFTFETARALYRCSHGVALYNSANQLIWGNGVNHIDLAAGQHELTYQLDGLPLQPGQYRWLTALHGEDGLIDEWDCTPELVIGTKPLNHARDEWSGVVNIPWKFCIYDTPKQGVPKGVPILPALNVSPH